MKIKRAFLILAILAIFGAVFYFIYPIVKERYFTEETEGEKETRIDAKIKPDKIFEEKPANINEEQTIKKEDEENNEPQEVPSLTSKDCDNECDQYKSDSKKLSYCQQVCGLKKSQAPADSCDNKTGLEKDYCFKDKAISQQDFEICEKIKDTTIKKTCQNRIAEELLEESHLEE